MVEKIGVHDWVVDRIEGVGGLDDLRKYELATTDDRPEVEGAYWVLRCLCREECEDSDAILFAIHAARGDDLAKRWAEDAERASRLERENAELRATVKKSDSLLRWINEEIMPFALMLWEAGEQRTDGYWMLDIICQGCPVNDIEDIRDELTAALAKKGGE